MNMKHLRFHDPQHRAVAVLGISSLTGLFLVVARFAVAREPAWFNLVWNLFLAWLPLLFAWRAVRSGTSLPVFLAWSCLWLLFLPNAPYLITDLVHLRPRPPVPMWFDIVLVQGFALTGLALGLMSLELLRLHLAERLPFRWTVVWTTMMILLCGFGLYLGRVERWNSWDLFVQPGHLLGRVAEIALHPLEHRRAVGFSMSHALLLGLAYGALRGLSQLPATRPARAAG